MCSEHIQAQVLWKIFKILVFLRFIGLFGIVQCKTGRTWAADQV